MDARILIDCIAAGTAWMLAPKLRTPTARQWLFLIVSYLFYLSVGGWFLAVLVGSSLFNYFWGRCLRQCPTAARLWSGILANLLLLGIFKYLPSIAALREAQSGLPAELAAIALPVGISFWTFQALSYLFDLYCEQELHPSLLEFCLYMAFAPTVLSGPVCRLPELLPQLRQHFSPRWTDVRYGAQRIWLGVFMTWLAQLLGTGIQPGEGVEAGFQAWHRLSSADVWLLAIAYGFQLFFDFAGYSHIVIGIGRAFGFRLPENFNHPYISTSPSVFWTRWHMSLSFWIRDYVFLPLATVRREIWWRNLALVISMVTFGLWHKATLLFIVWGAYHGILLVVHCLWQQFQRKIGLTWSGVPSISVSWAVTFLAVSLGWIFFRANDLPQAVTMWGTAFSPAAHTGLGLSPHFYLLVAAVVLGYFAFVGLAALAKGDERIFSWIPLELRFTCYAAMFYLVVFRAAQPQGFIYFQF